MAPRLVVAGVEAGGSEEATAPDPLVGRLLDGRYRLIECLAEGGMGTVYRAEHIALRKEVAIKLVQDAENADHALRFLREAMLISRIDHPNVISAIDYGTFDRGAAYLVMSLVEGPTLAHVMKFERPMSWIRAAKIGAQIADAVAAAQAHGIVHRDLKPENVVLQRMADGTDVVKVLDFGLAKYARDSLVPPRVLDAQHVTQTGVVVGTPGYMAPEQAVGMRADHRVDLYSIGVMLWECVAGRRLWNCGDVQRLLTAQLSSRPPLLRLESGDPSIPEDFEALVAELLATRPENRPQSAVETRERLRALVEAERSSQPRVELPRAAQLPIAQPHPDTDTVFIDAALAGWRAGGKAPRDAEASASADEQPPPTRVWVPAAAEPVVVPQAAEQPPTQIGFRGARMVENDAAAEVRESVQPREEPAADMASVPALEPASAGEPVDASAFEPHALLRPYVAVPLALAVLAAVFWAALAPDSSPAVSPASLRAHDRPTAAHSVASKSEATASPARSPMVPAPAANAPAAVLAPSPAQAPVTRTSSKTPALRSSTSTKQDEPGAVARVSTERELAQSLRTKALAHFRRAEFELAAQTYREAIKAAPGYAGAYAGLGASQLAVGDARGAISSYEQAIRRSPGTSGFHAALGRAYLMTLDRVRAVAEYRKAVALDPANEVASTALARLTL